MIRSLGLLLLLGACAAPAPITRIVTLTPQIPAALLNCAPAPDVPETTKQSVVAQYIVDLWQAGQDCRDHLYSVKTAADK